MNPSAPLIVHTDWSCAWGGQEIRTLTELIELKKLGFRVAMIVRHSSELARRGEKEGIDIHYIDFSSIFNLPAFFTLFLLIRRLKPAVVNTHSSKDSWMAGCVAKVCRVPLIIKTRHVLSPISSAFSYNAFFDVIFACSESIGKQLVKQKVTPKKVIVQSTGIDEDRFRFSASDRAEIRKQYGIADEDILVGNISFLRDYKGHEFIGRTAVTMPENFKFIIVGDGDGRIFLEQDLIESGGDKRIILAGHKEDPEHYFSALDIIFFSSYGVEGISQSFIQGLLYGVPLLVCRTPSIMEPLEYVHSYRDIEYDDVEAAHNALLELSNSLGRDEQRVEEQRQGISAKYGMKKMVKTIVSLYGEYGINPSQV